MYSACFVICMQSGHVDSTYWLLEEHKIQHVSSGEHFDSIKHIVDVKKCLLEMDKPFKDIVASLWFCLTASKQGYMTSHTV